MGNDDNSTVCLTFDANPSVGRFDCNYMDRNSCESSSRSMPPYTRIESIHRSSSGRCERESTKNKIKKNINWFDWFASDWSVAYFDSEIAFEATRERWVHSFHCWIGAGVFERNAAVWKCARILCNHIVAIHKVFTLIVDQSFNEKWVQLIECSECNCTWIAHRYNSSRPSSRAAKFRHSMHLSEWPSQSNSTAICCISCSLRFDAA